MAYQFGEIELQRIKHADGKVCLNLGAGDKLWDDAINVDMPGNYAGIKADVECDLHKLPFDDESVDEVHAIHVLEHFYFPEVDEIFKEWKRVLKPGGWLCIEVPCLEKIIANFQNVPLSRTKEYIQMTWLGLYGDQIPGHPEMIHKWCYSEGLLTRIFETHDFKEVTVSEPLFHLIQRDMRVVGQK